MRDEFGARDPRSQMLRFHTQTAGVQLTAQQPEVNLTRVTLQALAAVLGGTQSLHTNSYDEGDRAADAEKAATLALRTQQVLALGDRLDRHCRSAVPGSYAIEVDDRATSKPGHASCWTRLPRSAARLRRSSRVSRKAEIERSAYRIAREVDSGSAR